MALSYLTAGLPGTGGVFKRTPEDFQVDELPLYLPSGEGEHVYVRIRKRGIPTFEAVRRIAAALGLPERRVAYAGLKDAHAVTTQWLSLEEAEEDAVRDLDIQRVEILEVSRHRNKLRLGHLRGNRFSMVVRGAAPGAAAPVLERLTARGVPNYFGRQRFGTRGDTHRYGEALLRRDHESFVRRLLGGRSEGERDPRLKKARAHFDAGRLAEAHAALPPHRRAELKCLHTLMRFGSHERACRAVPKALRSLYVSAYQSWLFNRVLDRRIDEIDSLRRGDLAMLHRNGAVFRVEDVAAEMPRCEAFEISPTGPLFGARTDLAAGEPGRLERDVIRATGLTPGDFSGLGRQFRGERRALRVPLGDLTIDPLDETSFRIGFTLPRGSFATAVMREVTKLPELEPVPEAPETESSDPA